MIKNILLGGTVAISLLAISCSKDDETPEPTTPVVTPTATTQKLDINIAGLQDLGADFVYEGWLMVNGTPISTGIFTVDANGDWSPSTFDVKITDATAATKFILTIEPTIDPDPAPSDQKLIAGDFSGTSATISTATAPAIGDFSTAAGSAFLRTPTDELMGAANNMNDQYGIWFGIPGAPPTAGLTLPILPTGWAYEGWVIGDAGPISTGTFTTFDVADSQNSFSGTENNAGPPVPGEDFFLNAPMGETFPLDVRGRTVVISIEPSPDNSPAPFVLKPLLLTLPATAALAPTTHTLGQNLGSFPTGTVTR